MSTVGMPAWSREELESYLKAHFLPRPVEELRPVSASKARTEYYKKADLSSKQAADLSELLGELGPSFHERLFALIVESGMTDVEIYRKAGIDRKLFSKIRSNPAYHPRKSTIMAICIALRLDIANAKDLLSRAGYAFSPGSRSDLIVKFFIEHGVYDIDAVNYTLEEYKEAPLS